MTLWRDQTRGTSDVVVWYLNVEGGLGLGKEPLDRCGGIPQDLEVEPRGWPALEKRPNEDLGAFGGPPAAWS